MNQATQEAGTEAVQVGKAIMPELGDLVAYKVPDGEVRPATITHVWSPECVNLAVFTDGSHPQEFGGAASTHPVIHMTSVVKGSGDGQWEFMEDEEEEVEEEEI